MYVGQLVNGRNVQMIKEPFFDEHEFENNNDMVLNEDHETVSFATLLKEQFGSDDVHLDKIVRTEEFDNLFYYSGNDLGNLYTPTKTFFRLWAPTASEACLVTYQKWDSKKGKELAMKQDEKGTWVAELIGDRDELIYTYKVKIGDQWNEAVDPYAHAVTVNGDKGVVVNLRSTDPENWSSNKPALAKATDAIIYELHIRDLSSSSDSGIKNKGKFLGVAELHTKGPNGVKTGLSHIKDLGVTHIQFLPMFDFATVDETQLNKAQYNWGYDPKNYNVPEGSYSTNPFDPKVRIKEMKQMIQAVHDQGLRVIMDVVYNHVYELETSNLHAFVPGYYFRYKEDGTLSNGTGVGMDTASERKMMRKFIIDSVTYWAKEYQIDGFRFDLMGIHDVETMNAVRDVLDSIDPTIMILGEGWDLDTPLNPLLKATKKNADQMPGIAFFNDEIRDSLKGNVFDAPDKGFINGGHGLEDKIKQGIAGKVAVTPYIEPSQVITYTEVHDNYTIWDKLKNTNLYAPVSELIRMHKLASSIVLTSQGIPFIHAGQEFMRTKNGDSNSYRAPDSVNQLDWRRRSQFNDEVNYVRGLIELRKKYPAFRMSQSTDVHKYLTFIEAPSNTVAYLLADPEENNKEYELVIIHNANQHAVSVTLPYHGEWQLLVNGEQAGIQTISTIMDDTITVPAVCSYVLKCNKHTIISNKIAPSNYSDYAPHINKALEDVDSHKSVEDSTQLVINGHSKKLVIDDQLYEMIQTLSDEQKISLYMFLLSLRK